MRRRIGPAGVALTAAIVGACTLPPPDASAPEAEAAPAGGELAPGDRVHVEVVGHPDLSGTFELDRDGTFRMPLIDDVDAYGRTPGAVAEAIVAALADGFLRQPEVAVEAAAPRPVFVLGAVERPGSYPYRRGLTAGDVIAGAGGVVEAVGEPVITVTPAGRDRDQRVVDASAALTPGDIVELAEPAG